jgi:apolipoprotein N-acyltransferase
VIAPDGSVVSTVPSQSMSYVDTQVGLYTSVTPAVRIGPWLGRSCVALVIAGWVLAGTTTRTAYRRRTQRRDSEENADAPAPPTVTPAERIPTA